MHSTKFTPEIAGRRRPAQLRRVGGVLVPLLLLLLCGAGVAEAVSVSPTALYIDSRTRTGVMTLHNPGTLPEEISIGFAFGYPTSDASGQVSVQLLEQAPDGEPSATEWMRVFPRRLVLQPGQRQVIRVMVQPPADLPDGEYWARILISSRGGQPPIEQTDGDVSLQLNVETVLVMAANYRQGAVTTGAEVTAATVERAERELSLQVDLERTGNAALLGRLEAEVLDARGTVIGRGWDDVAVYRTMRRRVPIELPEGSTGPLTVRFRIIPERDDIPAGSILPFAPITRSVTVPQ
jgi:P pilus assembly chaperone PapD